MKQCAQCGTKMYRRPRDSWVYWESRKFCSARCGNFARPRAPIYERMMRMVSRTTECWLYLGARDPKGYGSMAADGRRDKCHRISFIHHHGAIPTGLWVLHKCDVPNCVNPDHLYAGTPRQNSDDMMRRKRWRPQYSKTTRPAINPAAKLNPDAVRDIRSSKAQGVELARRFGVSRGLVSAVRVGRVWRHVV